MNFIITIDTEADNQWARPKSVTTDNARFIPRFQALCDRFGFKPTYLCTYEMVMDRYFQDTVGPYQESGRAEIGAHLHPWTSPPFGPEEPAGTDHHSFPHELSLETFERKMVVLSDAIEQAFGRRPTSYRAGRYGFCEDHVPVLLKLGYQVDCSIAPFMSYVHVPGMPNGKGGMDFRRYRPGAYWLRGRDNNRLYAGGLLEVPITILFDKWPLCSWERLQSWLVHNPMHPATRLLRKAGYRPVWLRPLERTSAEDLKRVYDAAIRRRLPCAEMMFHSSELMPGSSPTFPNEQSIERLYAVFEAIFVHIAARGGEGVALTEFSKRFRSKVMQGSAEISSCGGSPR